MGIDFLIYGLDKAWYLAHPEIMNMKKKEELLYFMAHGALVIHAHPFREDPITIISGCFQDRFTVLKSSTQVVPMMSMKWQDFMQSIMGFSHLPVLIIIRVAE